MKIRLPARKARDVGKNGFEPAPLESSEVIPERPKAAPPKRGGMALLVVAAVVLAGAGIWRVQARSQPAPLGPTATVTRGTLDLTVAGSGSVQPARTIDLPFQAGGQVKEVLVKPGAHVKTGDVLARLDTRDLELQVQQAAANLKSAQAHLDVAQHGSATPEDLAASQAQLAGAAAAVEKARTGNVTAADIANSAAALRSAQTQLQKTKNGNVTQADILSAQASVRSAEAALAKARGGGITATDISNAEAAVRGAEAALQKTKTGGVTPADIANAQAGLHSAQAKLQVVQQGATPEQMSAAQTRLRQAQESYQKTATSDSASKTNAEEAVNQAADTVRTSQTNYSTAFWDNQQAQNGIDPKTGKSFVSEKLDPPTQQQQYATALHTAELQLSQSQSRLEQAKVTYESAKQQEVTDLANAQAQVDDAQVQLNELSKGPKSTDLAQAQAGVDQAQAQLDKLLQGGNPADIRQSQAQLDQARGQLTKLLAGGNPADIRQAQSQLDQARAQLMKLQQGGTAADIAIAQDSVAQAQAQFQKAQQGGSAADIKQAQSQLDQTKAAMEKLTAPAAEPDIATAQAGVDQASAALEAAKLNLDHGTLVAPFDGIVGTVSIVPGSIASASTAAMTLNDQSSLHIDLNMSESDVGRLQAGQSVKLTFDALAGTTVAGTVEAIAPTSTVQQNVVTYLVQVTFDPGATPVKLGMSATATITVQQVKDALLVPGRAIQTQGRDRTVQVLYGGATQPIAVHVDVGATNGTLTEITGCTDTGNQCLKEGDQLVLPTSTTTRTGQTTGGANRTGAGLFFGGNGGR